MQLSRRVVTCALFLALALPGLAGAEDTLAAAKDLYATAAYDDALAMLAKLPADGIDADARAQIDEYRAFCLFAMGRTPEAQAVIAELIKRNPLAALHSEDVSPRVAALLTDTQREILPAVIREKYAAGKGKVEAKDFTGAEQDLRLVRELIAHATAIGIKDPALSDVGLLADGFMALAAASKEKPAPAPAPVSAGAPARAGAPPSANGSSPALAKNTPDPARIYDATSTAVAPPSATRQTMPDVPAALIRTVTNRSGVLEIVIEPNGTVSSARMIQSLQPEYDVLVAKAALGWQYRPATLDGKPVRFSRLVGVSVNPSK